MKIGNTADESKQPMKELKITPKMAKLNSSLLELNKKVFEGIR